jgi:hypothetical protein
MLGSGVQAQLLGQEEKAPEPTGWDRSERVGNVGFQETSIEPRSKTCALSSVRPSDPVSGDAWGHGRTLKRNISDGLGVGCMYYV